MLKTLLNKNRLIRVIFVILILLFIRFDFFYFSLPHKVQSGETYWGVLNRHVFRNPNITRLSLEYLRDTHPEIDWDYVQANESGGGGYKVNVWMDKLTITGPNGNKILDKANLLPTNQLRNHTLQVVSYDLIVLSTAFFLHLYLLKYQYKFSRKMLNDLGGVFIIFVFSPILFFLMLVLLGNLF